MADEGREASQRAGLKPAFGQEEAYIERRVFVRTYWRWRFGREESVVAHTRRWPRQYSFNF